MWSIVIAILTLSGNIFGATIFHCPDEAICREHGAIEANSFRFLDKLGPKQYQTVTQLTIRNASLDKVPAELKYLKKLEYLDLSDNNIHVSSIPSLSHLKTLKISRNNIKGISLTLLPKNVVDLDLSNNLLAQIPKDWISLKALKTLHLDKNLFDCDCSSSNVLTYRSIVNHGINIPEPVTCSTPKHYAGKSLNSINCTAGDEMINDQPEEGSGVDEDIFTEKPLSVIPYLNEEDNIEENEVVDDKDEFPQKANFLTVQDSFTTLTPDEGSGDEEGSGFIEIEHVSACNFDCDTPKPVGFYDDKNDTAIVPGPTDQIKILAEDVLYPIFAEPTSSTTVGTTTTSSTTESPTTTSSTTLPPPPKEVNEAIVTKESQAVILKAVNTEVDVFPNETRMGEMENATALNQNNYAVYVVVVCGLLLAIVFLVCLIKKRKTKRLSKNRRDIPTGFGEELSNLEKPRIQQINEKNLKASNNIPEHVPLINGQNGKAKDDPFLKSYTPLKHPETAQEETDVDEPILRQNPGLLTPATERVTIRASEILESIPKTPVLVHRQKNSEGEIVTTVVPP